MPINQEGNLVTNDGLELIIPMKASSCSKEQLEQIMQDDNWTCDMKLDGHFMMAYINDFGDKPVRYFSRNVSRKTGYFTENTENLDCLIQTPTHIMHRFGSCIIAGELVHYKGKDVITSVINGSWTHCKEKQEELGKPTFVAFDILALGGVNYCNSVPLTERKKILHNIMMECNDAGTLDSLELINYDQYEFSDWWEVLSLDQHRRNILDDCNSFTKEQFWKDSQSQGFEGLVHKRKDSIYKPGYISNHQIRVWPTPNWVKQKIKREYDVVITGFTNAKHGVTGQFDGLIGAIKFSQYKKVNEFDRQFRLTEIGQASGFDVETRKDMTYNPEKYLGKVALIEAQERSSANDRLRHAQYKGLREDKNPEECIYNEYEC